MIVLFMADTIHFLKQAAVPEEGTINSEMEITATIIIKPRLYSSYLYLFMS